MLCRPSFLALLACPLATLAFAGPSDILPAEDLFRAPALSMPELSPHGTHLAAIATTDKDRRNLVAVDLKTGALSTLSAPQDYDVGNFDWLDDDRLVFNVNEEKIYALGLYTATIGDFRRNREIVASAATTIVGVPRARPGRLLVYLYSYHAHSNHLATGGLVELNADWSREQAIVHTFSPPDDGSAVDWTAGDDGELAFCITSSSGRYHLHHYLPASKSWRLIDLDPEAVVPVGIPRDGKSLWVVDHGSGGFQLRRYLFATGQLDIPVLTDPDYNPSEGRLFFSHTTGELAGIVYPKRQSASVWFDQTYAIAQATIDKNSPATINVLVSCDEEDKKFLFLISSPQTPERYTLLDLGARVLHPAMDARPWLENRRFQPVEPIAFKTRDGVSLEGYLTLPANASAAHRVPLVVLPHGGPWVRDTPDFDPEVQFLASRGYAVLQPNYRGSTGYAPAISSKFKFDFRRMHDDVTDATRAVMQLPVIDSSHVAIMGGSFGGYLAIAGVELEQGLYCCAVTMCGVFDWQQLIDSKENPSPGAYEWLRNNLGTKPDQLSQISLLDHVDQIHVPVFIAHGHDDANVRVTQSVELASKLKKYRVPHETFYRDLEGHGFYNYKNRVDYYHRVEAFLAANLGGATLTPVKSK